MENLICPYCEKKLVLEESYRSDIGDFGILKCDCYEYPIVSGIPIIVRKKLYNSNSDLEDITALIKRKRSREAFFDLLLSCVKNSPDSDLWIRSIPWVLKIPRVKRVYRRIDINRRRKSAKEFILRLPKSATARETIEFYFAYFGNQNKDARDYFYYRFGQPRHLVALSLASTVTGTQPIIDLACGMGHITRGISNMYPGNEVIGLDRDYFLLYIAKHIIAPNASYICCDADAPLPLKSSLAAGILCVNSFHFFSNKELCANELTRIVHGDGMIAITALRHSFIKVRTPNTALPPEGYLKLFPGREKILVADREVLGDYISCKGPNLSSQLSLADAKKEPLISIIVSNSRALFKEHGMFSKFPHQYGTLGINPLYTREYTKECEAGETYTLRFPSEYYKKDNPEMVGYLPETIKIHRKPHGIEAEVPKDASNFCVLMDIPARYG